MTATVYCAACGTRLTATDAFCASCGERQETRPSASPPPTGPEQGHSETASGENILVISGIVLVATLFILLSTGRGLGWFFLAILAAAGVAYGAWRTKTEGEGMSRQVDISTGSSGKIRSYWVGFTLALLTLGFYTLFWYYFVNDELKDIGSAKGDGNLAQSSPALSTVAISIGGWLLFPPFLSLYNYGQRIKRAQRLGRVSQEQQINPTLAFLLFFPGIFLILPYFIYFWYVTEHQNRALRANAAPVADGALATAGAVA